MNAPARRPIAYLGLTFDPRPIDENVANLSTRDPAAPCLRVVTPNVDHIVRLHDGRALNTAEIWDAYRAAEILLCDSRVLARLARFANRRLEVVPGSDLTACLLAEMAPGTRIALIGGTADSAGALRRRYPRAEIAQHCPPMGLRHDPIAMRAAAAFVVQSQARFTFLAVGSPQQELLAAVIARDENARGVVLCVGAAIDFLTGRAHRAPLWMQRAGLEWLHRLASEPRRMWRRYLVEGPRILAIAWRYRNQ